MIRNSRPILFEGPCDKCKRPARLFIFLAKFYCCGCFILEMRALERELIRP